MACLKMMGNGKGTSFVKGAEQVAHVLEATLGKVFLVVYHLYWVLQTLALL